MAETFALDAQSRSVTGKKVHQLRVQGFVPAVIYGYEFAPVSVQIPYRPLEIALKQAGGTNIINLSVDGSTHTVITREVQRDVMRGTITHVDFLAVSATTRITTEVPVHFINESPAVESRLGLLATMLQAIQMEAVAADLIDHVDVDLSVLAQVGDAIHVSDLKFSDRLTILTDPDTMIARVTPLAVVTEEETGEEAETTGGEPEVIQRGKAEEDEE